MNWQKRFQDLEQTSSSFGADAAPTAADVQSALNAFGANLVVDGKFGPQSVAALKAFQSAYGLAPDGIAGPQTLAALGFAGAARIADAPPAVSAASLYDALSPLVGSVSGLWNSVLGAFQNFSGIFEGNSLPYMYTDVKGLVTVGTGNLIDPIEVALSLQWERPDGTIASTEEVTLAWQTVKNAWPAVQSTACAGLTTIRLSRQSMADLVARQLKNNHAVLLQRYPGYTKWPADAQMALHSMAWAMGPAFSFPAFSAAVNRPVPDFRAAAVQSRMNDAGNPGLTPRNAANRQLFLNAADVLAKKADPSKLYYPGIVVAAGISLAWAVIAGSIGLFTVFLYQDLHRKGVL